MESLNLQWFFLLSQGAGQQPAIDALAIFFAKAGPYLLMGSLILFWFKATDWSRESLLEATEAGALGLVINQLIGLVYFHPRPFILELAQPLVWHAPENSFPSDHGTLLFTVAIYLLSRSEWHRQGGLLFVLACATGWGRIYAGIHFPFDMLGALAVALLSTATVLLLRILLRPLNQRLIKFYHLIRNQFNTGTRYRTDP